MPKTLRSMRLSLEEERFLLQWIRDEVHYQEGRGAAKRLQLLHGAIPADLATLIAAAIPDPTEQEAAVATVPSAEPLVWPWPEDRFRSRLAEARAVLAERSAELKG